MAAKPVFDRARRARGGLVELCVHATVRGSKHCVWSLTGAAPGAAPVNSSLPILIL
jgi:hypothetical protein